jgi:hypothetical protein
MKSAVEMGSGAMIYISSFVKTGSGIRNLMGGIHGHRHTDSKGRAVAQAGSRWFPTAAARVRVQAASGVCGAQSVIGAGFLRVLRFPLPIIPPISPSH